MGAYAFAPLHGYVHNSSSFIFPHPKTHPILDPNLRRCYFKGVCNTPLHGYVQNLTGFRRKPLSRGFSGRMQYAPTRARAKFGGVHISAHDMAQNPAGFGLCHTTWRETRQVFNFATRHGPKPGEFLTLSLDIARNPAGF